ncbi:hypothetical protein MRP26_21700 [Bacillus sp. CCB-MMP212]|uniref:hypothetical protein n=1 Tax=Bacillus sp. CCB-MMP212 TaxID=2928002 RepID=UPI001F608715|nr:hypothetical protein [Bacillus sp. CCB-MMP212]MCI4251539.1 hypothetical protein [Bacillus sp. CCB-MMP212]
MNSQNQQLVINSDRFIEKDFHRNLTVMEIEEDLSRMNARNIDVKEETATTMRSQRDDYANKDLRKVSTND